MCLGKGNGTAGCCRIAQCRKAIGLVRGIVILTVVHADRADGDADRIRIISARKATANERKRYEAQDDGS
jgi:uncharacterized DUF497 family protein